MSKTSEQLKWLAELYGALAERLNESTSLEERRELLCRMKILLDKLDGGVLTADERDKQETTSPPPPDQPAVGS
jgi:hypothetical protein